MTVPDTTSQTKGTALSLRHVSKRFGGVQALDNIDFEVDIGEVHCLAGENGCGKSTLIKIVTGVYAPDPGAELTYFGAKVEGISPAQARQHGIAVIWQDLALFPHMTVAENITFETLVGFGLRCVRRKALTEKARTALEKLGVDIDLAMQLGKLPIAQRQIVAIARALVNDAKLIFMDEPTASLTQTETDALLGIVRSLSAQGVAIVFVSHRLAEVLDISSRVTVVRDGKLVGVYPTQGMSQSRLGELMTGQTLEPHRSARAIANQPAKLVVQNLGRTGEYDDISFTLRRGEILGLIGLIGAGRTELAHTLFGMNKPDRGSFNLDGKPMDFRSNRAAISAGISYVSEDRLALGLIQQQSISENAAMSVLPKLANLFGLHSQTKEAALVSHWLTEFTVKYGQTTDAVSSLSGGNQQRVVLSKWLATQPQVLILDSPTVGVDVGARAGIFRIVKDLADAGLSILLISDEVTEVHSNADRIIHIAHGRIQAEYDPQIATVQEIEAAIYE